MEEFSSEWNRRKEGYSEPILLPGGQWRCVTLGLSELEVWCSMLNVFGEIHGVYAQEYCQCGAGVFEDVISLPGWLATFVLHSLAVTEIL